MADPNDKSSSRGSFYKAGKGNVLKFFESMYNPLSSNTIKEEEPAVKESPPPASSNVTNDSKENRPKTREELLRDYKNKKRAATKSRYKRNHAGLSPGPATIVSQPKPKRQFKAESQYRNKNHEKESFAAARSRLKKSGSIKQEAHMFAMTFPPPNGGGASSKTSNSKTTTNDDEALRIPCATVTDDSAEAGKRDLADALQQLVEAEQQNQLLQRELEAKNLNLTNVEKSLQASEKTAFENEEKLNELTTELSSKAEEILKLNEKLSTQESRIEAQQKLDEVLELNNALSAELSLKHIALEDATLKIKTIEEDSQSVISELRLESDKAKADAKSFSDQCEIWKKLVGPDPKTVKKNIQTFKATAESQTEKIRIMYKENTELISRLSYLENQNKAHGEQVVKSFETIEKLRKEVKDHVEENKNLKFQYRVMQDDLTKQVNTSESIRRQLHNKVIELKGNIRVFCRVRPASVGKEQSLCATDSAVFNLPDACEESRSIILAASKTDHVSYNSNNNSSSKKWRFEFDRVFGPSTTEEKMFVEVSALVQSAMDGYRVCVFAYGQTGSGKTFTMQGALNTVMSEERGQVGIIGRTISHVFGVAKEREVQGWKYSVKLEVVEIYNESIRDLLCRNSKEASPIELVADANGQPMLRNCTSLEVEDESQITHLLLHAMSGRSTKSTDSNEQSSRSHLIVSIRINGKNDLTNETRKGVVNLVDLAGSERLSKSGSGNDPAKLKECQAINSSLSSLGNVISSLVKKDKHVPFRNSKLTRLLQPYLTGDSKTLMICNLSPLPSHRCESLNTLRFAKMVNSCEVSLSVSGK